jgi:hypothetical protein
MTSFFLDNGAWYTSLFLSYVIPNRLDAFGQNQQRAGPGCVNYKCIFLVLYENDTNENLLRNCEEKNERCMTYARRTIDRGFHYEPINDSRERSKDCMIKILAEMTIYNYFSVGSMASTVIG